MLKTHSCGQLNSGHIGIEVTLAGWVDRRRDHGGLTFIDLRDREGITQIVFNPEVSADCHQIASEMRNEYVVRISGEVATRPAGTENSKLPTGNIEVVVRSTEILNKSETPPFYINEDVDVDENLRLNYRYLDLRRERMRRNLVLRHRMVKSIRDYLEDNDFIEVETPILIKSTPEGARDYLVPSRVHPGKFYALPQSPQQLKQLLMVAGLEKYYQIARCFRDEDTRADRQPEFTQLDLEASFVEENDILELIEGLLISVVKSVKPKIKIGKTFPRLTYTEAMARYGTDKPDLRFGLEIADLSDVAAKTNFAVFKSAVSDSGTVKGILAPGCADYSRSQLDELNQLAQGFGAKGLLTIALDKAVTSMETLTLEMVKSVAAKYMTVEQIKEMAGRLLANPGDLLLIAAGDFDMVSTVLGELRQEIGSRLNLPEVDRFAFAFVVDFPLLFRTGEHGRWQPMHHPFTAPKDKDASLLESAPEKVGGKHYDVVLNGYEIGGGSIRIHQSELQRQIFRLLGYADEEVNELFGHLLEAFDYGAPPHGGIALGLDRLAMLLAGEETIREVIAFPKNQAAVDMALDAPSPVTEEQLTELHLNLSDE